MKIVKGIFFFIMGLIIACCLGILVCALNPSLTAMLAERVESAYPTQGAQSVSSGIISGLLPDGTGQPGIDAGWIERVDYEQPDSQPVEAPDSVSGRMGYEPVQEEAQEIDQAEADSLSETVPSGETGSGLTFNGEIYPYYAMLEPAMQQIYSQIYANALNLVPSFTPVTEVSVRQLKTVFEAVYNDHPELFWLDSGYSCKYLKSGQCVEITLKYNATAGALEEARAAFEGAAGNIAAQAQGSEYEKERYVHDALVGLVEYDLRAPMNQSAYSALSGGRTVCAGYARAFQYIMQLLNVPCYYCTGFAGEDHAWNIIKLGDAYHNVDVTWDDTEPATYDYFNKSDRAYAPTHRRTGLSVYLPACVDGENPGGTVPGTEGDGGGTDGADGGNNGGNGAQSIDMDSLINPNPIEPMTWHNKVKMDPPVAVNAEPTAEERKKENLQKAGITEDQVRETMQEYYEDCQKLLKQAGTGDGQFVVVIPEALWSSIERAYNSEDYWKNYVDPVMKELGLQEFWVQLVAQNLGGGYYRLYHNIYVY